MVVMPRAVAALLVLSSLSLVQGGEKQGVLANPSNVALKIKPDPDGTSQLDFLVYGDNGAEFVLSNDNHGTFRIESGEKLCLEVKTKDENPKAPEAKTNLLQLSDQTDGRKRLRSAQGTLEARSGGTGRRLLSTGFNNKVTLAELIKSPGRFNVTGGYIASTSSGNVLANKVRQWKMIMHEDFHKGTVSDWTNQGDQFPLPDNNGISTCVKTTYPYADFFLGSYANMEAVKTYLLPAHSRVRVKARIHFIDDWMGEIVYLKINGNIVWSKAHKWCNTIVTTLCRPGNNKHADGARTISVCGNPRYPDTLSVPLLVDVAHNGVNLEISIGSNLKAGTGHATWGVDDLQIWIM